MIFSDRALWDKLHIVHCGIDPARYDPAPRQGPPHLTFVGRLAAVKGVPVLLEALSFLKGELPRLRVTLIGDGPERARLGQDAADLGLRDVVEFAGYFGLVGWLWWVDSRAPKAKDLEKAQNMA